MALRNTLVASAAVVVAAAGGRASAAPPGELGFGGRMGMVVTTINGEAVDDSAVATELKVGPTVAAVARWSLGPWSLAGELGFSDRGVALEDVDGPETLHLYYVDLPLIGGFSFDPGGGQLWPSFEVGTMLSVLAGRTDPIPGEPVSIDRRVDVGLLLGVGASAPLAGERLSCDLRYIGGLRGVSRGAGDAIARGHAFSLTLGYVF